MDTPPPPSPKPGRDHVAPFDHVAYERANQRASTGGPSASPFVMMLLTGVVTFGVALLLLMATGKLSDLTGGEDMSAAPLIFEAPICDSVPAGERAIIARSFETMRRTDEGVRLSDQLMSEDICVEVEGIANAGGYAQYSRGFLGVRTKARLVLARMLLEYADYDTIASVLVHEATHLDRDINDTRCGQCEYLPNGINLDEETAAHAAEAEWWIARYGPDGRQSWAPYSWYSIDNLAFAYQDGPEVFREYVRSIREDQPV